VSILKVDCGIGRTLVQKVEEKLNRHDKQKTISVAGMGEEFRQGSPLS
jgi:hypothetical protein